MRIEKGLELYRTGAVKGVDGAKAEGETKAGGTPAAAPVQRSDQVQISDAGRALAQKAEGVQGNREELSAERIAEIRRRIHEGAYNSLEVVEQVARRMLERGDV